ncbi:MAG: 4-hydroxy-tetrahydrodipicolinate synthase [Verrucomicrobiales bacterium]
MFAGVHTALITPFRKNKIDAATFKRVIDANFDGGVTGIVPCGTTGESPTLNHAEHRSVIELAIKGARRRGPVIAGTGSNSTAEAVSLTQAAEKAGADASLQVCPYYNKPSQEGLYQHFKAVAKATSLPIILYSIPGRSGIEISVETTARLAANCKNIVAMKEAGGSVERVSQLVAACPAGFEVLSGDDSLTLAFMAVGAVGVISVASNLIPQVMSDMVRHALFGRYEEALALHKKYYRLFSAFLKLDTNPVPIKAAMALAGYGSPALRLPMVGMDASKTAQLRKTLKALKIV